MKTSRTFLKSRVRHHERGGATMIAVFTLAILSLLVGVVIRTASNKYTVCYQTASWQEALFAAEAGADICMVELRSQALGSPAAWQTTYTHGSTTDKWYVITNGALVAASGSNATTFPKQLSTTLTSHAGEGNQALSINVIIDTPLSLMDASGRQWLRVRSTGSANLPGPQRVSSNKLDNMLRRLTLKYDRATGAVATTPRASRTIECIAKPSTMFGQALMSMVQYRNDGAGALTDSYDSRDGNKSTNGVYDPTKRQNNGDIANNAFPIKHDKTMDMNLNNDFIFGDASNNYSNITGLSSSYFNGVSPHPASNSNSQIQTNGNAVPTGAVATDFYRDLPRVTDPVWAGATNLGNIDNAEPDYTVSADPKNPSRFIATNINLSKSNTWTLKPPAGAADAYVEIWVNGPITLQDGGQVVIAPGVHATIYFDKNVTIDDSKNKSAGFDVQSDTASDLLMLGVEQPDQTQKIDDKYDVTYTPYKASGNIVVKNADFTGAIYAPDYNIVVDMNGVAKRLHLNGNWSHRLQSGVDIYGAFVGRTINVKGPTNFHYDEALNDVGPYRDYGYVSWFEDVNLDHR